MYTDNLYGKITLIDELLDLLDDPLLQRQANMAIGIPPCCLGGISTGTRLDHSVGTGLLAFLAASKQPFNAVRIALGTAGMIHDVGHTPFSHCGEAVLRIARGETHESRVVSMLDGSSLERRIVRRWGWDVYRDTLDILQGAHPFSGLVAGTLDVDTIDNSFRYGIACRCVSPNFPYCPQTLASQLSWSDSGKLYLDIGDIKQLKPGVHCIEIRQWEQCRHRVYEWINSSPIMSRFSMLRRALYLAWKEGKLSPNFFNLTDDDALRVLMNCSVSGTVELVSMLRKGAYYEDVFHRVYPGALPTCFSQAGLAFEWADELARECKLAPQDVCVRLGVNRAHKELSSLVPAHLLSPWGPQWIVTAFVSPTVLNAERMRWRVIEIMKTNLAASLQASAA